VDDIPNQRKQRTRQAAGNDPKLDGAVFPVTRGRAGRSRPGCIGWSQRQVQRFLDEVAAFARAA